MDGSNNNTSLSKKELMEAREAQKEARTLRRHVVSLNSQLEAAEAEIQAQRVELERAVERMEKDRLRTKEAQEKTKTGHAEEVKALKQQQDQSIREKQSHFEEQMETQRRQMMEMETRRKQEGGDWNKELASTMEREQGMNRSVAMLEYVRLQCIIHVVFRACCVCVWNYLFERLDVVLTLLIILFLHLLYLFTSRL
jgi:hypothetical protein